MEPLTPHAKPSKLVPVLIGAGAMTLTAVVPLLSFINCACCAGIMGGAILGAWYYKKGFPEPMVYTVGDGVGVGALAGIVAAVLTTLIEMLQAGLFTSGFSGKFNSELEQVFSQMESTGQDPAAVENMRQLIEQLVATPAILIAVMFVGTLLIFTGFGALGGVIGGNIFKTKIAPSLPQQPPTSNPS